MTTSIEYIHTFAERLLLGENDALTKDSFNNELGYAFEHAHTVLESRDEYHEHYKYELKLRLAMHFAPINAIKYDQCSNNTRHELVLQHLKKHFNRNDENSTHLANAVVNILEKWDNKRTNVAKYRDKLLKKQGFKCNHCNVKFKLDSKAYIIDTVFKKDPYKPYIYKQQNITEGYIEYTTPEVDHIKPIRSIGTNDEENLQLLCKLCNRAKSDILTVKTLDEIKYAASGIEEILNNNPHHIQRMLYFTIQRASGKCQKCGKKNELTMRKIIDDGPFVRSNLLAVCKKCLAKPSVSSR